MSIFAPDERRSWSLRRRRPPHEYRVIFLFFGTLFSLSTTLSDAAYPTGAADVHVTKVAAYYGPHRFHERNGLAKPENIDYSKIDRIMYGPFQLDSNGSIFVRDVNADPQLLFGPPDWNAPADAPKYCLNFAPDTQPNCAHYHYEKGLISRAHTNDVGVYLGIGGPELSENFSAMASDPGARTKFAQTAVFLMMNNDFDGLDIAWQFPQNDEDMFNYMLLLGDILLALKGQGKNETFGLTATVPCSLESMEHIDILALDSVLSEFNLLSFDFQGPWGGVVGANAPLYDPPDREGLSVSSCVTKYVEGGASRNKINIGLSFYGHSYRGGKYIGDKCEADWAGVCTDTQTWQEDDGSPQYHNIYEKMPELTLTFDPKTRSPLASNGAGAVSFDDPHSICLKTEYAMSNAGGILIIDLAADMLDDRSTPLLDAANLKILQPDIECDGRNFEQLFAWREVDGYEHVEPTKKIAEPTYEITEPSHENPEPSYRYICGIGEGNAKDNCSNGSDEAYSCDLGTCPSGMLCFVVLCTKPTQEKIIETSFSKQEPKPKMRPTDLNEIRPVLTASDEARPSSNSSEIFSPRDMDLPDETTTAAAITAPDMSFSCGVDSGHASSCGKSCPNGLIDCPMDHFCFWIKCNAPNSISAMSSTELPTQSPISAESAASWEHTTMKYQCGVTRNEALTCSEECGVAWKCSDGKDCYNVPCFTTS